LGIVAPAGTPKPAIEKLAAAFAPPGRCARAPVSDLGTNASGGDASSVCARLTPFGSLISRGDRVISQSGGQSAKITFDE